VKRRCFGVDCHRGSNRKGRVVAYVAEGHLVEDWDPFGHPDAVEPKLFLCVSGVSISERSKVTEDDPSEGLEQACVAKLLPHPIDAVGGLGDLFDEQDRVLCIDLPRCSDGSGEETQVSTDESSCCAWTLLQDIALNGGEDRREIVCKERLFDALDTCGAAFYKVLARCHRAVKTDEATLLRKDLVQHRDITETQEAFGVLLEEWEIKSIE